MGERTHLSFVRRLRTSVASKVRCKKSLAPSDSAPQISIPLLSAHYPAIVSGARVLSGHGPDGAT